MYFIFKPFLKNLECSLLWPIFFVRMPIVQFVLKNLVKIPFQPFFYCFVAVHFPNEINISFLFLGNRTFGINEIYPIKQRFFGFYHNSVPIDTFIEIWNWLNHFFVGFILIILDIKLLKCCSNVWLFI